MYLENGVIFHWPSSDASLYIIFHKGGLMKFRILIISLLFSLVLAAACNGGTAASTTATPTPTQTGTTQSGVVPPPSILMRQGFLLPELPRISAEDLKVIYDNRDPLVLVDVRDRPQYDSGYIPGARNIPNEPEADSLSKLKQLPKDRLIVLYCD